MKFLLVDDDEGNLRALEAMLRDEGRELHLARSGTDALELLFANEYALAVIDVQMPHMNGFELAETMRSTERTRRVPIIFVTGRAEDPRRVFEGYDAGAVDFLIKPIDPHALSNKAHTFFQLARQRQELERVGEELSETLRFNELFLAAVGHDLRTPLGAIVTGSDLLAMQVRDPSVAAVVARVSASAQRMAGMIEELMDLARARLSGGFALRPAPACLHEITRAVLDELQPQFAATTFEVTVSGSCRGVWDGDRIARMISNLVSNAARYGREGAPVRIAIEGEPRDRLRLRVWNAAVLSPEVRARLFQPFHRDQAPKAAQGLGLGLYIVDRIAHAHRGRVDVHSTLEGGTTFVVELPRAVPAIVP